MSFASDKLYNTYLRRKMPTIVSKVKVREIIIHLPCLTPHDRENIEAKRETCGNYDGMVLLLECLRRRENWPEQFIEALEACEHMTIANEIRDEYNTLRGVNNSNPSSPSATVTKAHVHPAPPASPQPLPQNGGNNQAAVAPPADVSAPPAPAAPASPPLESPVRPPAQNSAAHVPEVVSPPESVPQPPQSAQIEVAPAPSTPPPSPETPHTPASTPAPAPPPPPPQVNAHQEPEENSESDQDASVDNGMISDEVNAGNGDISVNSVASPAQQLETEALLNPDPLQTTATAEVSPPQSPSLTQADSDVTDGSSFLTLTPERPPVQDTAPPGDKIPAVILEPEETSEPPPAQVAESSPQVERAAPASALPGAAGMDASLFDTLCLSKPGQLVSIHPQNHDTPTIPAHDLPPEPYSGDSQRLEFSDPAPDAVASAHVPACSTVTSTNINTVNGLQCQENGIGANHNEPEENHYESPCPSLETQDVRENVVHVSGEASILNLDSQTFAPQGQVVNGEAAREIPPSSTTTADSVPNSNAPSEPAPELKTLPDSEEKTASRALTANTKYVLTAAGVGAFALLMAWKFKN